jgi:SP family general alpha glucoside:H+ symporter-like MFS transporter
MMAALAISIAFIFIPFFAPNFQTLLAGEILCGIPWGVFQTLTLAYASKCAPWRYGLTSLLLSIFAGLLVN